MKSPFEQNLLIQDANPPLIVDGTTFNFRRLLDYEFFSDRITIKNLFSFIFLTILFWIVGLVVKPKCRVEHRKDGIFFISYCNNIVALAQRHYFVRQEYNFQVEKIEEFWIQPFSRFSPEPVLRCITLRDPRSLPRVFPASEFAEIKP